MAASLIPLRQNLEAQGFSVNWDPNTKNITATKQGYNPITLYSGSYQNTDGRAYVDPNQLNSLLAGAANPTQLNKQSFQEINDVYSQMYQPYLDTAQTKLQDMLASIRTQAGTATTKAKSSYQQANANLQNTERRDRESAVKSAIARGVYSSGVADYQQNELSSMYAPEYQQLQTNQAATLADIQAQSAQQTSQLGSYATEAVNNYLANLMQGSLGQYNQQQNLAASQQQLISGILQGIGSQNYGMEQATLPWTQGLTPAEQATNELNWAQLNQQAANQKAANELNWAQLNQNAAGTSKTTTQNNLGTAMNDIWQEVNRRNAAGVPVNTALSQLEAEIWKNAGAYRQNGIDPQDLVDYLWKSVTGEMKPKPNASKTQTVPNPWDS